MWPVELPWTMCVSHRWSRSDRPCEVLVNATTAIIIGKTLRIRDCVADKVTAVATQYPLDFSASVGVCRATNEVILRPDTDEPSQTLLAVHLTTGEVRVVCCVPNTYWRRMVPSIGGTYVAYITQQCVNVVNVVTGTTRSVKFAYLDMVNGLGWSPEHLYVKMKDRGWHCLLDTGLAPVFGSVPPNVQHVCIPFINNVAYIPASNQQYFVSLIPDGEYSDLTLDGSAYYEENAHETIVYRDMALRFAWITAVISAQTSTACRPSGALDTAA
jgi:hypothetical protein